MRYVMKHDGKFVSYIHWLTINTPNFKYTDEINDAMVFKKDYLDLYEDKVKKTRLESILEKYPNIELKGVNIILNPIKLY